MAPAVLTVTLGTCHIQLSTDLQTTRVRTFVFAYLFLLSSATAAPPTPQLIEAATNGNADKLNALIRSGIDIDIKDPKVLYGDLFFLQIFLGRRYCHQDISCIPFSAHSFL